MADDVFVLAVGLAAVPGWLVAAMVAAAVVAAGALWWVR